MLFFRSNRKDRMRSNGKAPVLLHLPKAYIWVGAMQFTFSMACSILSVLPPEALGGVIVNGGIEISLLFLAFSFLGAVLVIAPLVWKVRLFRDEDYFLYTTWLGRTYTIKYTDIVYYTDSEMYLIIKMPKRTFYVDPMALNRHLLSHMLRMNKVKDLDAMSEDGCMTIRLPRVYLWVGAFMAVFMSVVVGAFIFLGKSEGGVIETLATVLLFSPGILLGVFYVLQARTWRIEVFKGRDHFVYTTCLGRTYTIDYADVAYFRDGNHYLSFKAKRTFYVDVKAINSEVLRKAFQRHDVKKVGWMPDIALFRKRR
ncbi:MAG TPA: hypothetical protein DEB24_04355 [Coriobacteriia bacterium]|nr:hypothetical protein [Coriobacteriia bacterium]